MWTDLSVGVLEEFAEAQGRAERPWEATEGRSGELRRDFGEDTWLGRELAYRCEYHREMASFRETRPRVDMTISPEAAAYVAARPAWHARSVQGSADSQRMRGWTWSAEDDELLFCLYEAGVEWEVILERLSVRRSFAAASSRMTTLKIARGVHSRELLDRRNENRRAA